MNGRVVTAALAIVVIASSLAMMQGRGAVDDLQLGGQIYFSDGTFLGTTGCADLTPFQIHFWDLLGNPRGSFASPVGTGTSGGWYSIYIPAANKGIDWDDGWTYTVEVGPAGCGITQQNYTSYGSGSYSDLNANLTQDPGEPNEYSGYGNLTNEVMWYSTDGWQLWDIQAPAPDLLPVNLLFNGLPGNRVVSLASGPHTVSFQVLNQGTTMVNVTSNSTAYNSSAPLAPFGTFSTQAVPAGITTSPAFSVGWTAPGVPGVVDICVEADWRTGLNDAIAETNELNNGACITISVALPNLVPEPVTVKVNGALFGSSPYSWQPTCLVVPLQISDTVIIEANATEVAGFNTAGAFTLQMYNTAFQPACNGARVGSPFFTSGPLGPLAGSGVTPLQSSPWPNPGTGSWTVNVTVDSWALGNITEGDETDNSFMIMFVIGGPDLTCGPISVDGTPVTFPQGTPILLTIAQAATILAQTTNIGGATSAIFALEAWESDSTGSVLLMLLGSQSIAGLGAGAASAPPMSFTDPWTTPGNYYITFLADANENVVEITNLNNNCTVWFQVQGPDLVPFNVLIDGVVAPPVKVLSIGVNMTLSAQVRNEGDSATGGPFTVTFWNATANCALRDPLPFLTMTFAALGPNAVSSETASSAWFDLTSGPRYIQIYVDSDVDVVEVDESNNTFCQDVIVGGLPDVAVTAFTVNGVLSSSPTSLDVIVGQVVRLGAGVTNFGPAASDLCPGGGSFDLVWYQVSPSRVIFRLAQGRLADSESRAVNTTAFPASLTPGAYEIRVIADFTAGDNPDAPTGVVCELDDSILPNNNVFSLTLNVVEPPPPPDVTLTATPNSVTLNWNPVAGATNYLIYRGPRPGTIDFTNPITTVAAPTTTYTDTAALSSADEAYYVIRSAESHGWRGASSDVVGAFRRSFPAGYTTFSLPLQPFPSSTATASGWADRILVNDRDAIYTWRPLDQMWLGHAKGMPPTLADFPIAFGVGYDIFHVATMQYTFVGLPATTISYYSGDNSDPRVGNEATFRDGLAVTISGGDVQLSWAATTDVSADEALLEYRVFKSSVRGGFDLTAVPAGTAPAGTTNWSEPSTGCAVAICESYYLVLAVNTNGRRGGSTFAVAVITQNLVPGYQYLGLRLDSGLVTAVGLLASLPTASQAGAVAYHTDDTQSIVGHAFEMPAGLSTFTILRGRGYTVYLRVAAAVVWIGR